MLRAEKCSHPVHTSPLPLPPPFTFFPQLASFLNGIVLFVFDIYPIAQFLAYPFLVPTDRVVQLIQIRDRKKQITVET